MPKVRPDFVLPGNIVMHSHGYEDLDPLTSLTLIDSDGVEWILTVGTDGSLITTMVTPPSGGGNFIGFPFGLTYAS